MSENYKSQGPTSMDELGMNENWSMHKSYGRYKKPELLKLPTERFKQLYEKVVKNHSQSPNSRNKAEDQVRSTIDPVIKKFQETNY